MIERLSGLAFLGSALVLGLLFGASLWVFARAMERWSFFRERRDDLNRLGDELVSRLQQGDFGGAQRAITQSPSIEAIVVGSALQWLDGGPDAVEAAIDAQRIEIRRELEQSLLPIAIIGRHAPWLGLVGTMVSLFDTLRSLDEPVKNAMSVFVQEISMALVPAAAGVIVGTATTIAHEILGQKVLYVDSGAAILTKRLLTVLNFKSHLAREFGLSENGHDVGAMADEFEEDVERDRFVPLAEAD